MRIVHHLRRMWAEDGGVMRAVLDMATWQARLGHDVVLATSDAKDVPEAWRKGGSGLPRIVELPAAPAPGLWGGRFGEAAKGLAADADVLHLHGLWDPSQLVLGRVCAASGRAYVISAHGMLGEWSLRQRRVKKVVYMRLWGRRLIDEARAIVLSAQGELEQSGPLHKNTPGVVIPLVFDTDPFLKLPTAELARERLSLPDPSLPSVLFLSRLHYVKRPDLVLAAAKRVRDAGIDFRVVMAGPGDEAYVHKITRMAAQLGLSEMVEFTGAVMDPAIKASLYRACDIFCLPSSHENFGFVYLESLACGTPIVTTKASAIWRELRESGAGHIVEKIRSDTPADDVGGGDVTELAATLRGLIERRSTLRDEGDKGRAWVLREMDPRVVTEKYIRMYAEAMRGKAGEAAG